MMNSVFKFINFQRTSFIKVPIAYISSTTPNNAGHSKWANIKHIKALKDGQRALQFTKLSRQIRQAIQEGGSTNPTANSLLRNAIDNALNKNMPMSSIQQTIKKCEQNKGQLKKYILEIKAFQKVHFICILYADNIAAVKMNLAPIVKKVSGTFVDARHLFDDRGIIEVILNENILKDIKFDKDKIEEICTEDAIECGAEEIEIIDSTKGIVNFLCDPIEIQRISNALSSKGYQVESSEHVFIPKVFVDIPSNDVQAIDTFVGKLKAIEGVEEIYDNINPDVR